MHKRIKEYPATGGMSTSAESVYEPKLMNYGLKLLRALHWHGVAMVEFKRDIRDNEFNLMEINHRFWGSLDLSIAAGVDFPHLLYKMAIEDDVKQVFNYKIGLRYTWVPNDLVRTFQDNAFRIRIKSFLNDLIDPRIRTNININDLNPSLIQLLTAVNRIIYRSHYLY